MQKTFDADREKDPKLNEIHFTDENKNDGLCMKIFCMDRESSDSLERRLLGFSRMYAMENGDQGFKISNAEERNTVKLTGNIHNALHILQERGLISSTLYNEISSCPETKIFLESSKEIVSSENHESVVMENIKDKSSPKFSFFNNRKDTEIQTQPELTFNKQINAYILVIPMKKNMQIKEDVIGNNSLAGKLADDCLEEITSYNMVSLANE